MLKTVALMVSLGAFGCSGYGGGDGGGAQGSAGPAPDRFEAAMTAAWVQQAEMQAADAPAIHWKAASCGSLPDVLSTESVVTPTPPPPEPRHTDCGYYWMDSGTNTAAVAWTGKFSDLPGFPDALAYRYLQLKAPDHLDNYVTRTAVAKWFAEGLASIGY